MSRVNPWKWNPALTIAAIALTVAMALVVSWNAGVLNHAWNTDMLHLSKLIFLVFLFGQYKAMSLALLISKCINNGLVFYPPALQHQKDTLYFIQDMLTVLGLVGTVVGFILGFGAMDPTTLSDISQLPAVIGALLIGLSTALYTTLIGAVCSLIMGMQMRVIEKAALEV